VTAAAAAVALLSLAPVTQAQSGRTFHVGLHGSLTLRLSERWSWSEPRLSSAAVELTPVEYFRDPGFREWRVIPRAGGRVTIRATGAPACGSCGDATRRFAVTVVVGPG
jgi:hypothetical protein